MSVLLTNCSFSYGKEISVLRGLSVEFGQGATVLLGPNGAGKSTLLALVVGLLMPDAGTVVVNGMGSHVRRERARYRRAVGWLPQQVAAVPGLTVRQQVAYAGWLKGLSKGDAWGRTVDALRRVGLADLADRPSTALSGGQLRRVGIAQTLVHDAQLIVMDEPSAGLDPIQRRGLRSALNAVAGDVDVIVSTHQTEDISEIYQHVVVLNAGTVRYHGSVTGFLGFAESGADVSRRAEDAYTQLIGAED
ncbi:ATP-binding cassette domain-containing protein [Dactylosporangium sp. NPDC051484]|uniref:ATP-binding cassette domain-containing protein n=1 Tax=Dactylosporangium sp. NPDC051484 TaxID=3154942 RepID=UPI00344B3D40